MIINISLNLRPFIKQKKKKVLKTLCLFTKENASIFNVGGKKLKKKEEITHSLKGDYSSLF
ncbi:hypothetical protein Mgra_00000893 [Meloidogyne graminicola]|uniref:Uncharacterized protein n=1 Tax=Meloidogyne graminicola TaxID=189291 RepID=A0A8T0A3P2_9BILA|nr:hypothetical protein Mgra_00000893 [Meloidogyne graminicola]